MKIARFLGGWAICLLVLAACTAVPDPTSTPIQSGAVATVVVERPSVTPVLSLPETPLPTLTPTLDPTTTTTPSLTPTIDIIAGVYRLLPTPTTWPLPTAASFLKTGSEEVPLVPGSPKSYLTTFRLITFYGHPNSPELGILSQYPRLEIIKQLSQMTEIYQTLMPEYIVLPTIHFISTVANAEPGEAQAYRQQTDMGTLAEWIEIAKSEGFAFILDIQPGRADILNEFERIRPFLYYPHVHLALDPEFVMAEDQVPGQQLGTLHATEINLIQAELNEIALAIGLNKVFIIHQFEDSMVTGKTQIEDYPFVELVFNADGFGAPETKISDLKQYATEPGWEYSGLKLFYAWDQPLLTPREVFEIDPQPAIIVYQ